MRFAKSRLAEGATIIVAGTPHWDQLANAFDLKRNHSDACSFLDGIHVDGAEGYFARIRCMIGVQQ